MVEVSEHRKNIRETPNGKWTIRFGAIAIFAWFTRQVINYLRQDPESDYYFEDTFSIYIIALLVIWIGIVLAIVAFVKHRNDTESTRWIVVGIPAVLIGVIVGSVILVGLALSAFT